MLGLSGKRREKGMVDLGATAGSLTRCGPWETARVAVNRADACSARSGRRCERRDRCVYGRVDLEDAVQAGDLEQLQNAVAVTDQGKPAATLSCRAPGGNERAQPGGI